MMLLRYSLSFAGGIVLIVIKIEIIVIYSKEIIKEAATSFNVTFYFKATGIAHFFDNLYGKRG